MTSASCSTTITGVSPVAQGLHTADETGRIGRVQADGGLVEDVGYADEAHTQLGGQAHALSFAAAETGVTAVEGEVTETHFEEELKAGFEAPEDLAELRVAIIRPVR